MVIIGQPNLRMNDQVIEIHVRALKNINDSDVDVLCPTRNDVVVVVSRCNLHVF